MYHSGQRELQDRFGSRALADRLDETLGRDRFNDADKAFVEESPFFFLATADARGRPDCSFKGGAPGFVRIAAPDQLVWADFDGNGMFRSLGNIAVNPRVGLLFMRIGETPGRLRINGEAKIDHDAAALAAFPGGQMLVRVTPSDIFPNCPRYIPRLDLAAPSIYAPKAGAAPVEPAWKSFDMFKDIVPPRRDGGVTIPGRRRDAIEAWTPRATATAAPTPTQTRPRSGNPPALRRRSGDALNQRPFNTEIRHHPAAGPGRRRHRPHRRTRPERRWRISPVSRLISTRSGP